MPTSSSHGKKWLTERFRQLHPRRVLDVGPGGGTYALRWRPLVWGDYWAAVEGFEIYVDEFNLRNLYDHVDVMDIRDYRWAEPFDLVIFGDVLEHMPYEEAKDVLEKAIANVGELGAVCVSVPIGEHPQGAVNGNDLERHVHSWTLEDLINLEPDNWRLEDIIATAWWGELEGFMELERSYEEDDDYDFDDNEYEYDYFTD